jgi:FkbM family methyltransferase
MIFSYQYLLNKYKISPKGIIHIGAHNAEESTVYSRSGTERVLWIEGNQDLIEVIQDNISIYAQNKVYQALLSDKDGDEVRFKVTNKTMSSSILELGTHKEQYPSIIVEKELILFTNRFDTFIEKNDITIEEYDFVNLDIQGAELLVLKGFGEIVNKINYIYTEVNIDNVYEGCPLLDEIDEFLLENGFQRVELSLEYKSWGDAFYIRKVLSTLEKEKTVSESKIIIKKFQENKNNIKEYIKPSLFKRGFRKIYNKIFKKKSDKSSKWIKISGEKAISYKLLEQFKNKENVVLFDIGANIGEYSEMLIEYCDKLNIKYQLHLFEPQKECIEVLLSKFNNNPNVIINNLAVSSKNGFIDFYVEAKGSYMSSIYKRDIFLSSEKIEVATVVLNDYINENCINKIHFVKIDVEGHELEVLKSAQNSFDKIENIQFEYGGTYLDSKCTLKDIYVLLRDSYHIGKISSDYVDFTPYTIELEDYKYSNYIAEQKDLKRTPIDYSKII